ncbi:MAG: hypothetical protein FDZ69_04520 [Deltaproteobacteria bacterium]|nr:MAG: hypothetical protein FDZ69_04520 [Deltaproteobacteria bacterium]
MTVKSSEPVSANALCAKCVRRCKQPATAVLVECPRFFPMPFRVERYRYDQLDLFGDDGG